MKPRSAVSEVVGWQGGTLRVRVAAAPVEGAANRALLELLARAVGVPRSAVSLVHGARGRDKLVRIAGLSRDLLEARLAAGRAAG